MLNNPKTVPLVKTSSEKDVNNTPKENGILNFIISIQLGIFVIVSTPRDNEIIKGMAYKMTPDVIPIRTYLTLN